MKHIAILGSSGGNLYNLGGKDPDRLLGEIFTQAESAGIKVSAIQFIGANTSMDSIKESTKASLYVLKDEKPVVDFHGLLTEANEQAGNHDAVIAQQIRNGDVEGLILMSIDPNGANKLAIEAAVEMKIPIVGTGGTAMAIVGSKGANVISTSGTTGTTNRTRAISFISSLAKFWEIKFRPAFGGASSSSEDGNSSSGNPLKRINIRGIMVSSLPAFISMALILALS